MAEIQTHLKLAGGESADTLLLRRWPGDGDPVLYVHGFTFPSALSVGYRFEGGSWADHLQGRGFDVWACDFLGYGGSTRPAQMDAPAAENRPFGRAVEAASQIGAVVNHIRRERDRVRVHLVRIPGAPWPPGFSPAALPMPSVAWCCSARSRSGECRDCRQPTNSGHGGTYPLRTN